MADVTTDTILIVDDEEPVRRTFSEWLHGANLGCTILTAPDAEAALQIANQQPIDLAVLDWALGAGDDGLQLLQDLYSFHPDIVAIMVTGYANQATPLDAMRMGVRDYLDKNHDLSRDTFLHAVRKQLEQIRPAKRARRLHQTLAAFREAVEKVLPLVHSAAALNDPVPLHEAIRCLVHFLMQVTQARDGVLFVRHYDASRQPAETCRVYNARGTILDVPLAPFNASLAGSAVSMQEACVMNDLERASGIELQAFERGHRSVLAVPLTVAAGTHVVIELFDKQAGPFTPEDQRLVQAAAELGTELLRQALGQRRQHQLLLDAVEASLHASETMAAALPSADSTRAATPPPAQVLDRLREGLSATPGDGANAEQCLALAEAVRALSAKHGPAAVATCIKIVNQVRTLLDEVVGG
jgi:two-component system, NtrC family, nitrogen regulation response regulator NtrX